MSPLLPLPSPAYSSSLWVYLVRALPSHPSLCHLPLLSASRNLPIYSSDSTQGKLYSSSCYQRNSFSCPFCIQFFLLTFSHCKSTVVGSYGLQPRISIYVMFFAIFLSFAYQFYELLNTTCINLKLNRFSSICLLHCSFVHVVSTFNYLRNVLLSNISVFFFVIFTFGVLFRQVFAITSLCTKN